MADLEGVLAYLRTHSLRTVETLLLSELEERAANPGLLSECKRDDEAGFSRDEAGSCSQARPPSHHPLAGAVRACYHPLHASSNAGTNLATTPAKQSKQQPAAGQP
jgi:hypothetical protein